jgi:Rod binding domain-containing protein
MATILPAAGPPPETLTDPQAARTWKAAKSFEAMALGQLLQPMFDTVDLSQTEFGGGSAEQTWRPMLVTEIAKQIAEAGGLGLAVPVYQQMLRIQESATAMPARGTSQRKPAP